MERSDIIKECSVFPLQYSSCTKEGSNLINERRCIALAIAKDILEPLIVASKPPSIIKHKVEIEIEIKVEIEVEIEVKAKIEIETIQQICK